MGAVEEWCAAGACARSPLGTPEGGTNAVTRKCRVGLAVLACLAFSVCLAPWIRPASDFVPAGPSSSPYVFWAAPPLISLSPSYLSPRPDSCFVWPPPRNSLFPPPEESLLALAERSWFGGVPVASLSRVTMVKKQTSKQGRGHLSRVAKGSAGARVPPAGAIIITPAAAARAAAATAKLARAAAAKTAAAATAAKVLRKKKTEQAKEAARAAREALVAAKEEETDSEEEGDDEEDDESTTRLVVPPSSNNPATSPPDVGVTGRIGGGSDPSGPLVTSRDGSLVS
eukprot:GHVU01088436.1.p1 GENE.GHVU01088436.1~~GHVU01088436.1.p1  ORF type:complete len:285 (-),score=46.60 GHVU01088436.1:82-936(-)